MLKLTKNWAYERMRVVIDIHSHILPGLDDGSKNIEETIKMLSVAVKEGIHGIVATPHYEAGHDEKWREKYKEAYQTVARYIETHNIPVQLYEGNEIFYSESIIEELQKGNIRTINGTRYILVEFPIYADYMYIERALHNLQYAGYLPIIAHVERYDSLRSVKSVKALKDMGAYIQINANSVTAKTKWSTRSFCLRLMRKKLVHFVATDAHGSNHRKPEIKACFEYLDKKLGRSYRRLVSVRNPEKVIEGVKIRE